MKKFILSFLSVFIISAAYAQSTTSSVAGSVNVAGATVVVEHGFLLVQPKHQLPMILEILILVD